MDQLTQPQTPPRPSPPAAKPASGARDRLAALATRDDAHLWALAGIVAIAALLRFIALDTQSFWFDESVTAVDDLRPSLVATLERIPDMELSPHGYFALLWGWTEVFGLSEAGIRSLSALVGTLTVPVAYLAGRELASVRVGLMAAALTAVCPELVWHSQEARPYALLVLAGMASLLFFARTLRRGGGRDLVWWAIASSLALVVHYFAGFLVVAEGAWLLYALQGRRRHVALAGLPVAATALALLPLAMHQRDQVGADWIRGLPLTDRLLDVPERFFGSWPSVENPAWVVPFAVVAAGFVLLALRAHGQERRGAAVAFGLGAATLAIPLAMSLVGAGDYFSGRHLMVALGPLLVALAAGFAARGVGRVGLGLGAVLCAGWLAMDVAVPFWSKLQRDDWRGAVAALGPARADRVIVLEPPWAREPLQYYGHPVRVLAREGPATVSEVAWLGTDRPDFTPTAPPGFSEVERRRVQRLTMVRYRAPRPTRVSHAELAPQFATLPFGVVLDPARR